VNEELRSKIVQFRDNRDWGQFHTSKNLAVSISIEAAELLELFQWAKDDELGQVIEDKRDQISEELADLSIYLTLMSHDLGIDLIKAIEGKLETNNRKYPVAKAKGSARKYTEFQSD